MTDPLPPPEFIAYGELNGRLVDHILVAINEERGASKVVLAMTDPITRTSLVYMIPPAYARQLAAQILNKADEVDETNGVEHE